MKLINIKKILKFIYNALVVVALTLVCVAILMIISTTIILIGILLQPLGWIVVVSVFLYSGWLVADAWGLIKK
jgi:presenilin-like A22 family membrane protease